MRNTLVVVQVALALVLVVSAALMIRSFQALRDVDPGFSDPATLQTAKIWIPTTLFPDPDEYTRMEHEILDKIAALPSVASAGFASTLPMEGQQANGPPVGVEGQTLAPGDSPTSRRFKFISPGYFEAMGTRILAGRDVTWSDIETGGRVALISEDFAREIAAEPAGALGRRIRLPFGEDALREVIGVVQSVHQDGLYEEPPSFVYWPVRMERFGNAPVVGTSAVTFVIRSERAGTASLMNEVRQAVNSVNGNIPIALEGTMQNLYTDSLARTSFTLVMLAIAGGDGFGARRHRDLRRHRLRRLAEGSRDRHSIGARRATATSQEDVPAARARAWRRGCCSRVSSRPWYWGVSCRRCCTASARWTPRPTSRRSVSPSRPRRLRAICRHGARQRSTRSRPSGQSSPG